ncbi:MAG: hypothetical protein R2794_11900 [Chitinophagales bacterium]
MFKRIAILATGLAIPLVLLQSCQQAANGSNTSSPEQGVADMHQPEPFQPTQQWKDYWYAGKGELTSYKLTQSRYGELHNGTTVIVFVTEDLSAQKQVKLDDPASAGADKLPVLKMNQSTKFVTGIYPYSMMLSTFQPVDIHTYPHAVKVTASVQEWCGMTYYQMNARKDKFQMESRSYFESEGDKNTEMDPVLQEDELWNWIRIAPDKLPVGAQKMFPGAYYLRLSHHTAAVTNVTCSLQDENGLRTYTMEMPDLNRTLKIHFQAAFPYKIMGWEDTFPGFDGKPLTTKGEYMKYILLDYWRAHNNDDRALRKELDLPEDWQ